MTSITRLFTLNHPLQQGWPMYAQLLIDLFKFLAPFLRNAELPKYTALLYKVSVYPEAVSNSSNFGCGSYRWQQG